jgi:hypothetical protein
MIFPVLEVVRVRVVPSVESWLRTAEETKSERMAVERCEKVQTRTSEIGQVPEVGMAHVRDKFVAMTLGEYGNIE